MSSAIFSSSSTTRIRMVVMVRAVRQRVNAYPRFLWTFSSVPHGSLTGGSHDRTRCRCRPPFTPKAVRLCTTETRGVLLPWFTVPASSLPRPAHSRH